jgi:hypothetical protein
MSYSVVTAAATTTTPLGTVEQIKTLAPALWTNHRSLANHHPRLRLAGFDHERGVAARDRDGRAVGSLPAPEGGLAWPEGAGGEQCSAPEARLVLDERYCGGWFPPAHVKISFVSVPDV